MEEDVWLVTFRRTQNLLWTMRCVFGMEMWRILTVKLTGLLAEQKKDALENIDYVQKNFNWDTIVEKTLGLYSEGCR